MRCFDLSTSEGTTEVPVNTPNNVFNIMSSAITLYILFTLPLIAGYLERTQAKHKLYPQTFLESNYEWMPNSIQILVQLNSNQEIPEYSEHRVLVWTDRYEAEVSIRKRIPSH